MLFRKNICLIHTYHIRLFHSRIGPLELKMLYLLISIGVLGSISVSEPLQPGEPGGPWTEQEINIVRQKVLLVNEKYVRTLQKKS